MSKPLASVPSGRPRPGRQVREGDVGVDLVAVVDERAAETEQNCHDGDDPKADDAQTGSPRMPRRNDCLAPGGTARRAPGVGRGPDSPAAVELDEGHGQVSHIGPSGRARHRRDPPAGCRGRWPTPTITVIPSSTG